MRSRSVLIAIAISGLCAAGAVGCYLKASRLRSDGAWYLARGEAQAQEYAATFDGAIAETELATFEQRRVVLERSHLWQRLELILIMAAVVGAFSSYVLYLYYRLRQQLVSQDEGSDPQPELPTTR